MAHLNKVLRSIETEDGDRCVDIFVRPDGTFGFEEYRREAEDVRGWFAIGFHSDRSFPSEADATISAMNSVLWLNEALAE